MANFDLALQVVLGNEGGLVYDPSDPGGVTKYGISKRNYPQLDIPALTTGQAATIYHRDYWRFDQLADQAIANKLFDMGVNLGFSTMVRILQGIEDVKQDGVWGPVTNDRIGQVPQLLVKLRVAHVEHYLELLAKDEDLSKFRAGWLMRACQ